MTNPTNPADGDVVTHDEADRVLWSFSAPVPKIDGGLDLLRRYIAQQRANEAQQSSDQGSGEVDELGKRVSDAIELRGMATLGNWNLGKFVNIGRGFIVNLVPGLLSVTVKNKDDAYFIQSAHANVDLIRDLYNELQLARAALTAKVSP